MKGVQKIGGLWRLYIESQNSRIKLIKKEGQENKEIYCLHDAERVRHVFGALS